MEDGAENIAHLKIISSEINSTWTTILDAVNYENIHKNKTVRVVTSIEYFRIKSRLKLQSIELLKTFH